MFQQLDEAAIEDILRKQYIGRLGCHANGKTYVIPISYAYDGKYIWAHAEAGMKVAMMRENPDVCFQTDNLENMANWKSVIAWGKYEEITDAKQREEGLCTLLNRKLPADASATAKLSADWPFHPAQYNDIQGVVFRICLTEKTGRSERSEPNIFTQAM